LTDSLNKPLSSTLSKTSIIPKAITEYDLRLLRVFVSVVEHGGFSAAEKGLGITRSTISVHMSNLETRIRLRLCLRGGFLLTEDGRSVYRAVINLFDSLKIKFRPKANWVRQ
jgi:hypothetical protein